MTAKRARSTRVARLRKVKMIHSVGELPGGETVMLDPDKADEFIIKGYAEGELSREYSEAELAALHGPTQVVKL